MLRVALLNATRRRGRSLGIVASLAAGGFLILAVSSMQTDPAAGAERRDSGTGGFALYAESTVPIVDPTELTKAVSEARVVPIRVYEGEDASCLNLNRAQTPRVLGVDTQELAKLGAFDKDVWALLSRDFGSGVVPALVGDADTAMWTLKKKTGEEDGDSLQYKDEAGRDVALKLVGHLPMRLSVFQGTVLISAENFTKLWPSREGFRVFLLDVPAGSQGVVAETLTNTFDRQGMDVASTVERLEMFHSVEATYLSMFLILGGIGLLLGASATGIVVLRNLLERRREIALLRAVGFTSKSLLKLLGSEYGVLLALGAVIGGAASLVAMFPALTSSHSEASPLWRFAVFLLVLLSAALCSWGALIVGLRRTDTSSLRAE